MPNMQLADVKGQRQTGDTDGGEPATGTAVPSSAAAVGSADLEPEPEQFPPAPKLHGGGVSDDVLQHSDSNPPERSFLQNERQRNQTYLQPRDDPPEMTYEQSIQVLQNAIRSVASKKKVNNMKGIRELGLALTQATQTEQHRVDMWKDMWEMVASTLKMPKEARSEVKLKLLRGFCRDVSIFGKLGIEEEVLQTKICRRMQLHVAEAVRDPCPQSLFLVKRRRTFLEVFAPRNICSSRVACSLRSSVSAQHEIIFSQGASGNLAYCLLSGSVQIGVHGRKVRTVSFGEVRL